MKKLCSAACVLALAAASTQAGVITKDLGGGWSVTIFNSDLVDVVTDFVDDDILVIQKFATFTEIDEFTGLPAGIHLTFRQNRPDDETVSRIILTSEIAENQTGIGWTAFRHILTGTQVEFNEVLSEDFTIDPFTARSYSADSREFTAFDGFIPNGGTWEPGVDVKGGLTIDIDLGRDTAVNFTLKELPVPGPGPAVLAVLGVIGLGIRRRP